MGRRTSIETAESNTQPFSGIEIEKQAGMEARANQWIPQNSVSAWQRDAQIPFRCLSWKAFRQDQRLGGVSRLPIPLKFDLPMRLSVS